MPFLSNVNITFNTHDDDKDGDTLLHVFIKNRSNDSSDPESDSDFISNLLAYQRALSLGDTEINPYLAFGEALLVGWSFSDPSTEPFDLPLASSTIKMEDVVLPVVNIHILPNGNDRWIFSYTTTFTFDNGQSFSFDSNTNGVKGIILDQDNKNYSGICTENPFINIPPVVKPVTDAVLTRVILEFATHNDNKDNDTRLNVHIVNRLNASTSQDIAIGLDIFSGQEFQDPSYMRYTWSANTNALAANTILLRDMILPVINIIISPNGNDRWIFDYRITFEFTNIQSDGFKTVQSFSSSTGGIILDQDNNKYSGVYQGRPFPTLTPPTAPPLTAHPLTIQNKIISLAFLQQKLDQFVNQRQGIGTQDPPMVKLRLHNTGKFWGDTLPESYFDLQSINAICGGVEYISSPSSLGQLTGTLGIGDLYLDDINSKSITVNIDTTQPAPIIVEIDFETDGPNETIGGLGGMNFTHFSIVLKLTIHFDAVNHKIDVMSWIDDIEGLAYTPAGNNNYRVTGNFLGAPIDAITASPDSFKSDIINNVIDVSVTAGTFELGGTFQKAFRGKIYDKLKDTNQFTKRTIRDSVNSSINSLILGGIIDDTYNDGISNANNNIVQNVQIQDNNLAVTYIGPLSAFEFPYPADWPNASTNPDSPYDFSPGNLANIDHIIVLSLENRSFDQMLGYLSLPKNKGGMARVEVDGLKGGEVNVYNGQTYPSFPFAGTCFSPDPPHSYEPVNQAINGGAMDGFVKSYAAEHGDAIAGNIMGYHTGVNVPVYDALARDFSISHHWFASHPGPTFCNRFYELTGRLNTDPKGFWEFSNSASRIPVFTKTIFDYIEDYEHLDSRVTWKYFEDHYCFLRFFEKYTYDHTNIADMNDPEFGFFAGARSGNLPSVSFIDPHFIEMPPNGNCDGPPADVKDGQALVQKVVEAVVASPAWQKTLLIITYDEHGGFYDHVPPPPATKISEESPIGTYGVRVPAFFISPWFSQAGVFGHDAQAQPTGGSGDSLHFDHTSLSKTIARRFMSDYPPYMGARYRDAKDLSAIMNATARQTILLPFIRYNVLYNPSAKSMDVQWASFATGTPIWQYDANDTEAQHFSFEEAGDGLFYIRTHCGNYYLTVYVPPIIVTEPIPPIANEATAVATVHTIIQDVKYGYGGITVLNSHQPAYQKWLITNPGITVLDRDIFTISNPAFPGMVLKAASNDSQAAVVLGAPDGGRFPFQHLNTWKITSPLINHQVVVTA